MKWWHVYLWSTVIGTLLGVLWAVFFYNEIWSHDGGIEFIKQIMTVIVFLAVPVGAICGAALAALLHFMIWASGGIPTQRSSRRMSLSDEERRAFEKELRQAEAEGKEVWTRK